MYEGTAAKRFNIEDTHGIIFWLSHSLELDLINQLAKKKFIGRTLVHVYRSK